MYRLLSTYRNAVKCGIFNSKELSYEQFCEDEKNGIINIIQVEQNIFMQKKTEVLNKHPYKISEGMQRGRRYVFTYVRKTDGNLKKIRALTFDEMEEKLYVYYTKIEEEPTIMDLFFTWLDDKKKLNVEGQPQLRPASIRKYKNEYNRFIRGTEFENKRISEVSKDDLYDFCVDNIRNYALTAKAFSGLRTIIIGMFKRAMRLGLTDIDPEMFFKSIDVSKKMFKSRPKKKAEEQIFFDYEAIEIINYIDENPTLRNLGIALSFETGVRVGELSTVKIEDIDSIKRTLNVLRTEITYDGEDGHSVCDVQMIPKTECADRTIYLTDRAYHIIEKIIELNPNGSFLFEENGKRIREHAFRKTLYRLCDKVGCPRKSPHAIRRTYASALLSAGVNESLVMEQMGHSDISTTRKFYEFCRDDAENKRLQIENALNFCKEQVE